MLSFRYTYQNTENLVPVGEGDRMHVFPTRRNMKAKAGKMINSACCRTEKLSVSDMLLPTFTIIELDTNAGRRNRREDSPTVEKESARFKDYNL